MALNGLNSYLNGFNNNGYDAYNLPSAEDNAKIRQGSNAVDQKSAETGSQAPAKEERGKGLDLTVSEIPERGNASIENIAISFGSYDSSSIELFGEKGLASSDMKQAISGMQRDHILHEYQYFVGGKDLTGKESNIIAGTSDGLVIRL